MGSDLAILAAELEAAEAALRVATGEAQALHGDAHVGNLIPTATGLLWNDFEDACRGPVEWDLATLMRVSAFAADPVLEAYGREIKESDLEPFLRARDLQGTVWLQVLAERFPDVSGRAEQHLRRWRGRA